MAKINISFNNKDYSIDEASLSPAADSLKNHLSTIMNGTGATINFGGTAYSIDSAKLLAATNDFISHLGIVAGNGYKVIVNGTEYSVGSDKVAGAVSDLEIVLGDLHTEDEGGSGSGDVGGDYPAAGLYETGSDYTVMLKSWDELLADGTVHVDNGVVYTNMDTNTYVNSSSDALVGDLVLPNDGSITELGESAFDTCVYLTGVIIPNSVTAIGSYAFYDCSSITNISFNGTVEECSNIVFGYEWDVNILVTCIVCSNGTFPDVSNLAAGLYESNSKYTVMLKSWDELVADGTVHVDNGSVYTNYDNDSWSNGSCDALSGDLVLPNDGSITEISENAFMRCQYLSGIVIPDSVTTIGTYAFYHCSLKNVKIGNGVTRIVANAFHSAGLQSVIIPDSVTVIEDNAFNNNTSLSSVWLGNGVTTIGEYVFVGSKMQSITIPKSVTKIGSWAISEVSFVYFDGTVAEWNSIELGENWINLSNEPKVVCSDGTVTL